MLHSGKLHPYSQTLDKNKKAFQGRWSRLIWTFVNYTQKSLVALVLLKLPNTDAVTIDDSDKRVSLLQHLDITVMKNVYRTGQTKWQDGSYL
jgi:hypothetical protein